MALASQIPGIRGEYSAGTGLGLCLPGSEVGASWHGRGLHPLGAGIRFRIRLGKGAIMWHRHWLYLNAALSPGRFSKSPQGSGRWGPLLAGADAAPARPTLQREGAHRTLVVEDAQPDPAPRPPRGNLCQPRGPKQPPPTPCIPKTRTGSQRSTIHAAGFSLQNSEGRTRRISR